MACEENAMANHSELGLRLPYGFVKNCFRTSLGKLLFLLALALSNTALAHKIDTHVWIAQQVLNDVLPDGTLSFPEFDTEYPIDPMLRLNLLRCQDEYRMGAIGPDAFPDMVAGQMTTHPGIPDDANRWQTNDWLTQVLFVGSAMGGCAEAFAFGYLTHAASDVFAHTYVNIYSGDIFAFDDGLEEELRHMALEAFVSKHMPPIRDNNGFVLQPHEIVRVPATFVSSALILNSAVANEYRAVNETRYLAAMYDLWAKLNELITEAESLANKITQEISKIEVCLLKIPLPLLPDIDWGCVDLEPIHDLICLDCGDYNACAIKDVWPCEHANACWLVPTDPVGCTTREILKNSGQILADSVTHPLRQWRDAVEEAVLQYAYTQEEIAREIMRGDDGDPMGAYTRWLTCWGTAFSGAVPKIVSQTCDTSLSALNALTGGISSFRQRIADLPYGIGWALDPIKKISDTVKPALYEGLLDGLDSLAADGSTLDSLILMRRMEHNDETLNGEFQWNSSDKELLEIPDVAARVRAEMMIDPLTDQWTPGYPVIHNSIVLSKLLLLPALEVNRMVSDAGVGATAYGPTLYPNDSPFSPLLGMARSIDGSHQWQEYAPPYARDCDPSTEELEECLAKDESYFAERNYGYAFAEPEGGFRIWQDCDVREKVFKKLFVGPIARGLEMADELGFVDLLPPNHPLRGSEDDPFPESPESQTIDNIPPVPDVTELPAVTTSCHEPAAILPPTATDACQGIFTGLTPDSLNYGTPGRYEVVWTYEDGVGNRSQQSQTIIVEDHTPPTLSPPPSVSVEQTSLDGTPATLGAANATDNCDGDVMITNDAPSVYPLGETIVTFTAVDVVGNRTEEKVSVVVVDTTPPTLALVPASITLEQESLDGTAHDVGLPDVSDICDAEPDLESTALAVYPLGITEVVFTATDDSGNVATASTWVTVVDTTPPVLESVTPSKDYLWPPNHKMVPIRIAPVVSDFCDADPACRIIEVTSSQPINDTADGDTDIDWQIVGDLKVKLLSERAGNDFDEHRIYTITTQCTDASGNASNSMSATVIVPVEIEDLDG